MKEIAEHQSKLRDFDSCFTFTGPFLQFELREIYLWIRIRNDFIKWAKFIWSCFCLWETALRASNRNEINPYSRRKCQTCEQSIFWFDYLFFYALDCANCTETLYIALTLSECLAEYFLFGFFPKRQRTKWCGCVRFSETENEQRERRYPNLNGIRDGNLIRMQPDDHCIILM